MIESTPEYTEGRWYEEECNLLDQGYLQELATESDIMQIIQESIPDFAKQSSAHLSNLRDAFHREDNHTIHFLVHKFNGLSGFYGAQRIKIMLKSFDRAIAENDYELAGNILDEISIIADKTITALILHFKHDTAE
jgi:HPt (histidine-containing phosphotransfer) domain-containing protein